MKLPSLTHNKRLLPGLLTYKIETLARDLDGLIQPLARLVIIQVFKISNSTDFKL